jgi:hypothetical protein
MMDKVVNTYVWGSILLAILFFIISSGCLYWITNRLSTSIGGPTLYSFARGGPTLSGVVVHTLVFFAIVFGIVDYIYTTLCGDDDSNIVVN